VATKFETVVYAKAPAIDVWVPFLVFARADEPIKQRGMSTIATLHVAI
jgi:hypothetical protein